MIGSASRKSCSTRAWANGPQVLGAVAIVGVCCLLFLPTMRSVTFGIDSKAIWSGAHGLVTKGDPYVGGSALYPFVYLPSCALIFAPFAAFSDQDFAVGMLVLDQVAMVALGVGYAVAAGLRATSSRVTPIVIALLLCPLGINTVAIGNASILVAALGLWSLILISRQRWYIAALLLGLAIAIKPIVVFVVLVFIVRRAFRQLVTVTTVPLILNVAVLPFAKDPMSFISEVVPHLLSGGLVRPELNSSLWVRGQALAFPAWTVLGVQVLVVSMVCLCIYAWRDARDLHDYIILTTTPAIGMFLVSRVDEPHFNLISLAMCIAIFRTANGLLRYIAIPVIGVFVASSLPAVTGLTSAAQVVLLGSAAWLACLRTMDQRSRTSMRDILSKIGLGRNAE